MSVAIEDLFHRGMTESCGDGFRIRSLCDQESNVGVSEIVGAHRLTDGFSYSRPPYPATEVGPAQGLSLDGGENEPIWPRQVGGEVACEGLNREFWQRNGSL